MASEGASDTTPFSDCPVPIGEREEILNDSAILPIDAREGARLAFTTDSFVVTPFGEALPRIC